MSRPHIPAELLDYIVDHLYDARDALKSCCLVSKSWIPCARKHLFASVGFYDATGLQSWKNTFPDPSTSPACYTHHLVVCCSEAVTFADAEERSLIAAFSRVVHLQMFVNAKTPSLIPFHGFSPALKYLSVTYRCFPFSRTLNLIRSFPLIEHLTLIAFYYDPSIYGDDGFDGQQTTIQPSFSGGTLGLCINGGMDLIIPHLLPLQDRLRFRTLVLTLNNEEDILSISLLVERCCLTLESLMVYVGCYNELAPHSIDLSKATGLKEVELAWIHNPRWVAIALRTITRDHGNLQQVSLEASSRSYGMNLCSDNPADVVKDIGETSYQGWLELDSVLAQLWESHSVRPVVTYKVLPESPDGGTAGRRVRSLLSGVTATGMVDLVEQSEE